MSVILFSVKYNLETKLVAITETTTYPDFVSEVVGKWGELKNTQFYCLCGVGSITSCCLESDVDLKNILLLCNHTSERLVLVEVIIKPPFVGKDQFPQTVNLNTQCNDLENSGFGKKNSDECNGWGKRGSGRRSTSQSSESQIRGSGKNSSGECNDDQNIGSRKNSSSECNEDQIRGSGKKHSGEFSEYTNCGSGKKDRCECSGSPKGGSCKKHKLPSYCESDSEDVMPSYAVCPTLKKKPLLSDEWANIINVGVGQEFGGGAIEFRKELIKFATHRGFNFKYKKNTREYIYAWCSEEADGGCSWYVRAKLIKLSNNFKIFKANTNHSCNGNLVCENGIRLGSNIMADLLVEHVKKNHSIGGKDLTNIFLSGYGIDTPYWKAQRAVQSARKLVFGCYDESYNQLRWYKKAIERTNPGSVVLLEINQESNRFERMFVAFKASVDGFRSCRPMLFIDATFMKGQAKGTLLSATAKDGDNGLFPVAFAIVGAENFENWEWFLTKIRDHIHHDRRIVFISDRNVGLMSAFPRVWDEPLHFFCLFHLEMNLKGRFSRGCSRQHRANMAKLFKECAYAPNTTVFNQKLELFKKEGGPVAEEWIEQLPFDKWVVAHTKHIKRYGEMTSNAAESFNSWILKARYLPITNMIDSIRKKLSRWFVERRNESSQWTGALCPSKEEKWQRYTDFGRSWKVEEGPNSTYEVHSPVSATVNLSLKVCTCYQWQVRGFPCPHAVAVIRKSRSSIHMHVDVGFLTKSYMESYMGDINSIPDTERYENQSMEEGPKILPPHLNTPAGRPRTKRKKSFGEGKKRKKNICKTCGTLGYHDSVSCLIGRADETGSDSMQSSDDEVDKSENEHDTSVGSW